MADDVVVDDSVVTAPPRPSRPSPEPVAPVSTELEPHELEKKKRLDLLKSVREVRNGQLFNPAGELKNMDSSKVYKWINVDPKRQVAFKSLRYRPVVSIIGKKTIKNKTTGEVLRTEREVIGVDSDWICEDGHHRRGDLELFEVDRDWYEALKADEQLRALEMTEGAEQQFEKFAERLGVPSYNPIR